MAQGTQTYLVPGSIIVLVIGILAALGYFSLSGSEEVALNNGGLFPLPDLTLEDHNGNTHSFSDFQGEVLIINSWATWCPFCVTELPDFAELQEEFGDDIQVIAVNRKESLEESKSYVEDRGIADGMLFLLDPEDSFYRSIGGFSMPETIYVNKEGEIVIHKRGFMPLSEMREKTQEVLAQY
ncbi:hypothetical protein CL654_01130 [bacterium]|nr:hypothetical protein [bacterium]|tara:strand:+ start:13861 stop:14406 length:546 start_codon:yes stop_codon:yes gene_type:complete